MRQSERESAFISLDENVFYPDIPMEENKVRPGLSSSAAQSIPHILQQLSDIEVVWLATHEIEARPFVFILRCLQSLRAERCHIRGHIVEAFQRREYCRYGSSWDRKRTRGELFLGWVQHLCWRDLEQRLYDQLHGSRQFQRKLEEVR